VSTSTEIVNVEKLHLEASLEGRSIKVQLEGNKVVAVNFDGTASDHEAVIFSAVAEAMVGHSLREAAEHSALYAAKDLRDTNALPEKKTNGIKLPKSINSDLGRAESILRKIYRESPFWQLGAKEWNYEDRGISEQWSSQAKPDKKRKVGEYLEQYLALNQIQPDSVVKFDIDKYERIDVQISDFVAIEEKPKLLMGFERYLRSQTKERLEVFAFEMKDLNRIRRL